MKKALFLDRDGIINVDKGYIFKKEDVEFVDGIFDLCAMAAERGYLLAVITNQAGIARGLYTHEDVHRLHDWIMGVFREKGAALSGIYYCPHHPEFTGECGCRKPAPGMIQSAAADLDIDIKSSVMLGDKVSDMQAGKNAGVGICVLVSSRYVDEKPAEADVMTDSVRNVYEYLKTVM